MLLSRLIFWFQDPLYFTQCNWLFIRRKQNLGINYYLHSIFILENKAVQLLLVQKRTCFVKILRQEDIWKDYHYFQTTDKFLLQNCIIRVVTPVYQSPPVYKIRKCDIRNTKWLCKIQKTKHIQQSKITVTDKITFHLKMNQFDNTSTTFIRNSWKPKYLCFWHMKK